MLSKTQTFKSKALYKGNIAHITCCSLTIGNNVEITINQDKFVKIEHDLTNDAIINLPVQIKKSQFLLISIRLENGKTTFKKIIKK